MAWALAIAWGWCGLFHAAESWEPRVDTLRFHASRLSAITVPESLQAEKEKRLTALQELLDKGASEEESFRALYFAIDDVRQWLWAHAADRPHPVPGEFRETADSWQVLGPHLTLALRRDTLAMTVMTANATWEWEPADTRDIAFDDGHVSLLHATVRAEPMATGYGMGMALHFTDFPEKPGFECRVTYLLTDSEMTVDIAAGEPDSALQWMRWPKAVRSGSGTESVAVIPRMQGMLLPGDWPQAVHAEELSHSRSFYMPWWGHLDGENGLLVIQETSDDAGGFYRHPSGGPTRVGPIWYGSLGRLGYLRTIRYVFQEHASHVTFAKRYRRWVQERGEFVSLREKAARTPALEEVIGRPVIHLGALYHFVREASLFNRERIEANHALQTFDQLREQLERLHAAGVASAYVHLDGWGFYGYDNGHPDVMPPGEIQGGWEGLRRLADRCAELGYFFAVHDQYRDFYFNAVSFDDRLAAIRKDGTREEHSVWCGGPQTILSPRFAPGYVRRNHDLFAANGVRVRGAYLDVFAVVPLEESSQPAHPVTRSDCARHRRECFDLLRARGYVVSSEEPADYLVRSLDLVHHGPYATYPNIGGGGACGIPVPLFSLVYHDSILLPWEMGEDGGWGIPRGDSGRLHCLLNAGLPYIGPHADAAEIGRVREATELAAHCAFLEMTTHEFLDASGRKQRAAYADGTEVIVDFDAGTYEIRCPAGNPKS